MIVVGIILLGVIGFFAVNVLGNLFRPKNDKVTLEYWGLWEDKNTMQPIIDEFEKQNPGITINYVKQSSADYKQRVITRIQNGTGPDIFRYNNTWLSQVAGILAPLSSDAISPSDFKKNFYPVQVSDLTKNGAIYGIPLEIDTLALFTNKDLFNAAGEKVPTTWDEFQTTAVNLTTKDTDGKIKVSGAALGTFSNITHAPDIVGLLFAQSGVNLQNIASTSNNAQSALEYYTQFTKSIQNTWDDTLDPSIVAFSKGNLAMYIGYSWDIFTIKAANPDLAFEIHAIPHLPQADPMTVSSYWVEGVSAKSKHPKEAMKFMNFLSQKETQQKLFTAQSKTRLFGEPPARVDLASTLADNPWVYPFVKQAPNAVSTIFVSDTTPKDEAGYNTSLNQYLENAVNQILGNTSAQTAIATLSQGVSSVLQKYAPSQQ